ncbi:MAG TPA: DNA mismatch repair endonuclease MutL [Verrucomicrobiae bacterium]|nr:DNA mismatch repair endonuclease MutL [Verrucomicrobiae bacterium]
MSGAPTGRIHVLPPAIADAIAAGEVVERPASVVKELVENALDAGARQVWVEIDQGGRDRIRVGDNGGGLAPDELRLAFGRHATSKVASLGDLTRIATLGFRGEALASIGAVARVDAVSRRPEDEAAARVVVRSAEVEGPRPAPGPVGTTLTVTELFATTPARRAFLRPPRTEGLACARVLADCALAAPDVVFELVSDGRRVLRTPGSGELLDVVRAVFGAAAARGCRPVADQRDGFEVVGVLGGPQVARTSRAGLVVFVNGRRVQQRSLQAAVETACRGVLEAGRHPLAVLDLRCDPSQVDVNVHPTKREVRFRDERAAFLALERACWTTLHGGGLGLRMELPAPNDPPSALPVTEATAWGLPVAPSAARPGGDWPLAATAVGPDPQHPETPLAELHSWRLLGQVHHQYLIAEAPDGLALVDQHAAHERVLYHRLLDRLEAQPPPPPDSVGAAGLAAGGSAQGWLIPELVELAAPLVAGLSAAAPTLARLGIALEPFGDTTVRCTASPAGVRPARIAELVAELVEEALADRPDGGAMRRHRLAALVACHTAVRFGDPLASPAAERLLHDLADAPASLTCPHGRPTVIRLGDRELRRAFHRPPV